MRRRRVGSSINALPRECSAIYGAGYGVGGIHIHLLLSLRVRGSDRFYTMFQGVGVSLGSFFHLIVGAIILLNSVMRRSCSPEYVGISFTRRLFGHPKC